MIAIEYKSQESPRIHPESQSPSEFPKELKKPLWETLHEFAILDIQTLPPPPIIINSSLLDPRNLVCNEWRRPLNFPCKSIYTQGSSHGLVTRLTNSLHRLHQPAKVTSRELSLFDSPSSPFPVYSPVSRYVIPDECELDRKKLNKSERAPMKVGLARVHKRGW